MTDPNLPPPERVIVEPRHTTVNVQPERRGGGGGVVALLVIGLLVVVAIVAFVLLNGSENPVTDAADTNVDVEVNLPDLPEAPKLPEAPNLPPIEPPTVPSQG